LRAKEHQLSFLKHRTTISSEISASRVPLAKADGFLVYRIEKVRFVTERIVTGKVDHHIW